MARTLLTVVVASTVSLSAPLNGQEVTVESLPPDAPIIEKVAELDAQASAPGTAVPFQLSADSSNEIVVTGPRNESDMRVPSSADERAEAAAAAARTPCAGCVVMSGASVRVGFGRPPPMPILIDLKAIPEAPPGSDAARYADE